MSVTVSRLNTNIPQPWCQQLVCIICCCSLGFPWVRFHGGCYRLGIDLPFACECSAYTLGQVCSTRHRGPFLSPTVPHMFSEDQACADYIDSAVIFLHSFGGKARFVLNSVCPHDPLSSSSPNRWNSSGRVRLIKSKALVRPAEQSVLWYTVAKREGVTRCLILGRDA